MPKINRSELTAALTVGVIGLLVLWIGTGYSFGSPRRMGPGFVPVIVGIVVLLLSGGLVAEALRAPPVPFRLPVRAFVMVLLSILVFASLIDRAGLVPAIFGLVFLAAAAERPIRPMRTLLLAVALSALGTAVFIQALGLPLAVVGG